MLKEQLTRVKESLCDVLAKGELKEREYWETVYKALSDEGILKGPYKHDENSTLTVRIATRLIPKIPAEELKGLKGSYVSRVDVEISEDAQKDINNYNDLVQSTRNHLREQIGDDSISRSDYEEILIEYIMELPVYKEMKKTYEEGRHLEQHPSYIILTIVERLVSEFNIQEEPEVIAGHNLSDLKSIIEDL